LPLRAEGEIAHARMHTISTDHQSKLILAAGFETRAHHLATILQRRKRPAVADHDAGVVRAVGKDALEIAAQQIDIIAAKRAPHMLDRHLQVGTAARIHEFKRVDRVVHGTQLAGKAHAFGHVPAGAEEIHHVVFAPKAALTLDQQRIEAGLLELDGEGQPGDTAVGNEDAFAVRAGCPLCRRLPGNIGRGRSNHSGAHCRG